MSKVEKRTGVFSCFYTAAVMVIIPVAYAYRKNISYNHNINVSPRRLVLDCTCIFLLERNIWQFYDSDRTLKNHIHNTYYNINRAITKTVFNWLPQTIRVNNINTWYIILNNPKYANEIKNHNWTEAMFNTYFGRCVNNVHDYEFYMLCSVPNEIIDKCLTPDKILSLFPDAQKIPYCVFTDKFMTFLIQNDRLDIIKHIPHNKWNIEVLKMFLNKIDVTSEFKYLNILTEVPHELIVKLDYNYNYRNVVHKLYWITKRIDSMPDWSITHEILVCEVNNNISYINKLPRNLHFTVCQDLHKNGLLEKLHKNRVQLTNQYVIKSLVYLDAKYLNRMNCASVTEPDIIKFLLNAIQESKYNNIHIRMGELVEAQCKNNRMQNININIKLTPNTAYVYVGQYINNTNAMKLLVDTTMPDNKSKKQYTIL